MDDKQGDIHGVDNVEQLISHWSSNCSNSSGVGPPPTDCTENHKNEQHTSWNVSWIAKMNFTHIEMTCALPAESFFCINSKAVVRSHIWIAPLLWPDKMKRRGIDPIRDDFSHSCTQNEVIVDPSMDFITHTRSPFDANLTYNWSVSGITFCTNTCSSSCSPNGPKSLPAE